MAFDGITVRALCDELGGNLSSGRISKISQTESDELIVTIRSNNNNYRLFICASATLPLVYLTSSNKQAPLTAPNFCMLLRKHIGNGKIESVTQPSLERVLDFEISHTDELGDFRTKHLIVELMGKHSNIIFTDDEYMIIDSIKHVSSVVSSVRTVLPGRKYFIPNTQDKINPLSCDYDTFNSAISKKPCEVFKAIYTSFTGISPIVASSICEEAGIDPGISSNVLTDESIERLYSEFINLISRINNKDYVYTSYESGEKPEEFSAIPLRGFEDCNAKIFDSISQLLEYYYAARNNYVRIRQKSSDLRRIVKAALEKDVKKLDIQERQMKDTDKMDKFKRNGNLLSTYAYQIESGSKKVTLNDYYTGEDVTITLDETLTPIENANRFYDKYSKLKRTKEALSTIITETTASIEYLRSIEVLIDMAQNEEDLSSIRAELEMTGYIKKSLQNNKKGNKQAKSKPLHYLTRNGIDLFVGKNNLQNEELTFKIANGNDWWFHCKTFPGSHVIMKLSGIEPADSDFEDAASLAAHFSSASNQDKVEIDYIQRKHVKKVPGSMPGFVIYHTNYSMSISPDISHLKQL